MVQNNDERVDSDSVTLENIVEKGMVVAVLADDPNYEYYLQKLTTSCNNVAPVTNLCLGGATKGSPFVTMEQNKYCS